VKINKNGMGSEAPDRLLSAAEVAERLGTSIRFPRRLIEERRIQIVHVGRHVRIPASALEAWIESNAQALAVRASLPAPAPRTMGASRPTREEPREGQMASRRAFGSARELPSGKWQVRYRGPDEVRRTAPKTFDTRVAAQQWLVTIQAEMLNRTWMDPAPGEEAASTFVARWIAERGLRPRTAELYTWLAKKYIDPTFGRIPVARVTPAAVRTWHARLLTDGVSASMTAKAYRLLRAVFNTAVADGLIRQNPCRIKAGGIHTPTERPTLSLAQVLQLTQLFPPKYSAMVHLAAFGGLRYGEVIALRRCDLDLRAGTVSVRSAYVGLTNGQMLLGPPKSRAGVRTLTLPVVAVQALATHLDLYVGAAQESLLFTGATGNPFRRTSFNKVTKWSDAVTAIGAPALHFHDLRHTGNTLAAGTPGTSTRDLMERLGHDSVRAAMVYQHATRDADRRIAASFDAQLAALDVQDVVLVPGPDAKVVATEPKHAFRGDRPLPSH
jgi:excisionase family DNA binding protein